MPHSGRTTNEHDVVITDTLLYKYINYHFHVGHRCRQQRRHPKNPACAPQVLQDNFQQDCYY